MRVRLFRNPRFLLPLAIAALILPTSVAYATTRIVNNLGDNGSGTLRDTIAVCGDGDIITFSVTGKINLNSGPLTIARNISINGPGANLLEVTRQAGAFGIFVINANSAVTISGITISNGHGVFANSFSQAGGISNIGGGTLAVDGCVFNGNTTDGEGGAILGGTLTATNCTFINNTATEGGAIYVESVDVNVTVASCTFSGNQAKAASNGGFGHGGAILSFGHTPLTVTNCTFSQNIAGGFGGAINNFGSPGARLTTTVSNSSFTGNVSSQSGGALYGGFGRYTLNNCTFANNTATNAGGGIFNKNGVLLLINCTLANNTASQSGGGIHNQGDGNGFAGTAAVGNCTFSRNTAPNGGGIYNTGTQAGNAFVQLGSTILYSTNADPGANLVNDGSGTSITSVGYNLSSDSGGGVLTATADQINTDPKLGPLQNNGGPTMTMALLAGSPAQDKGRDFASGFDQRGLHRPVDIPAIPNAKDGDGSDIGAVEMTDVPPFIVTTTADHDDGSCNLSDCTLREAINAANAASGTNTILFASGVTGTITLQPAGGTLNVTDSVTIVGPGASILAVSGNEAIRVFNFNGGTSIISGLTIRDGWLAGNSGDGASRFGGGIYNHATLTISRCMFTNNFVSGANNLSNAGTGGNAQGGAIYNDANLTVNQSTFGPVGSPFNPNTVVGGAGGQSTAQFGTGGMGGVGQGGAIYSSGFMTLTNCTFQGNGAVGGGGGPDTMHFGGPGADGSGGAIFSSGPITMTGCTLSGNQAVAGAGGQGNNTLNNGNPGVGSGGGIKNSTVIPLVQSSIIAGNTGNHGGGADVDGAFSSGGYNLIGTADHSSGFNATADQTGTDASPLNPMLDSLKSHGGQTDVMGLLAGSPAIDKGNSFGNIADQLGLPIFDDPSIPNAADARDIGAFELNGGRQLPTVLANISTRLLVETGDNVLIGGFIITGTQPKKIIVRAIGPSLNLAGKLADPILELHGPNGFTTITNDNWRTDQEAAIMASGVPPTNDLESAIVATLPANGAGYTAIVRGVSNGTGIGVVEAYDLDRLADSKLANISTRGLVQTGDNVLIAGTIVAGNTTQKVIIRALGPSTGVPGAMADPTLELHDGNGAILESNDNWVDSPNKQAIIDSGIPPTDNHESAIVYNFSANNSLYTAILRGVNNSTGVAVVEIYTLQ
jgi:CSLREA domain-containing protein